MPVHDTIYQARLLLPDLIERGRDNTLTCPVYKDGVLAAPASGTLSLFDGTDTAVVNAQSVTITGSIATYALSAAMLSSRVLGEGWRAEWALSMPDTATHTFRNDAALVRNQLHPVVTDLDLYRRHSDLNPASAAPAVPSGTDFQSFLEESWVTIQNRLIAAGNRPNLITSPSAFREVHLHMTLALIFWDFSTSTGQGKWQKLAEKYDTDARAAWEGLSFTYDTDDDGRADDPSQRRSARSVTFLGGASGWRGWS